LNIFQILVIRKVGSKRAGALVFVIRFFVLFMQSSFIHC